MADVSVLQRRRSWTATISATWWRGSVLHCVWHVPWTLAVPRRSWSGGKTGTASTTAGCDIGPSTPLWGSATFDWATPVDIGAKRRTGSVQLEPLSSFTSTVRAIHHGLLYNSYYLELHVLSVMDISGHMV